MLHSSSFDIDNSQNRGENCTWRQKLWESYHASGNSHRRNSRKGFTLAELLITVAIILILAGFAFVAVIQYQRNLKVLEDDGVAEEIFMAAQNHLIASQATGEWKSYYEENKDDKNSSANSGLGAKMGQQPSDWDTASGGEENDSFSDTDKHDFRYFIVDPNNNKIDSSPLSESALQYILPYGSTDESVRSGQSYIIEYDAMSGAIYGVFYTDGTRGSFGNNDPSYFNSSIYPSDDFNAARTDKNKRKSGFKTTGNTAVYGYYGGASAKGDSNDFKAPVLSVRNAEELVLTVVDPNVYNTYKPQLDLTVYGNISGASITRTLVLDNVNTGTHTRSGSGFGYYWEAELGKGDFSGGRLYRIYLDSVTTPNGHFCNLFPCSDGSDDPSDNQVKTITEALKKRSDNTLKSYNGKRFIPGEDITLTVKATATVKGGSAEASVTTNSLFESVTLAKNSNSQTEATISNARHLLNLSSYISRVPGNYYKNGNTTKYYTYPDAHDNKIATLTQKVSITRDIWWNDYAPAPKGEKGFNETAGISSEKADGIEAFLTALKPGSTNDTSSVQVYLSNGVSVQGVGKYVGIANDYIELFEGNNHVLGNFDMADSTASDNESRRHSGLISDVCNNPDGKSLTVNNVTLLNPRSVSNLCAGSLIGAVDSSSQTVTISHCLTIATKDNSLYIGEKAGTDQNQTFMGGLIGFLGANGGSGSFTIKDCAVIGGKEDKIFGSFAVGGLVGELYGAKKADIFNCMASSYEKCLVKASVAHSGVGGLIGVFDGTGDVKITGCYAGGRTHNGQYGTDTEGDQTAESYNIITTGFTKQLAGGLIGEANNSTNSLNLNVHYCYSTASVYSESSSPKAAASGSLIGGSTVGSPSIVVGYCYTTGLINTDDGANDGCTGFVGKMDGGAVNFDGRCRYLVGINPNDIKAVGSGTAVGSENVKGAMFGQKKTPFALTNAERRDKNLPYEEWENRYYYSVDPSDYKIVSDEEAEDHSAFYDETLPNIKKWKNKIEETERDKVLKNLYRGTYPFMSVARTVIPDHVVELLMGEEDSEVEANSENKEKTNAEEQASEEKSSPDDGIYYHIGDWPIPTITDSTLRIENSNTLTAVVGIPKDILEMNTGLGTTKSVPGGSANGGAQYISVAVKGNTSYSTTSKAEYLLLKVTKTGTGNAVTDYQVSLVGNPSSITTDTLDFKLQRMIPSETNGQSSSEDGTDTTRGWTAKNINQNANVLSTYGKVTGTQSNALSIREALPSAKSGGTAGGGNGTSEAKQNIFQRAAAVIRRAAGVSGAASVPASGKPTSDSYEKRYYAYTYSGKDKDGNDLKDANGSTVNSVEVHENPDYYYIEIALDDITREGTNFASLFPDLTPGEDITVYAAGGLKTYTEMAAGTTDEAGKLITAKAGAELLKAKNNTQNQSKQSDNKKTYGDGAVRETISKQTATDPSDSSKTVEGYYFDSSMNGNFAVTNSLFADGTNAGAANAQSSVGQYPDNTAYTAVGTIADGRITCTPDELSRQNEVDGVYHLGSYEENTGVLTGDTNGTPRASAQLVHVTTAGRTANNTVNSGTTGKTGTDFADVAIVMNGRHLQNLASDVSGVNTKTGDGAVTLDSAELHNDIVWAGEYSFTTAGATGASNQEADSAELADASSLADDSVAKQMVDGGILSSFITGTAGAAPADSSNSTAVTRTQVHLNGTANDTASNRPAAGRFLGIVNNGLTRLDGGLYYGSTGSGDTQKPAQVHTIYNLAENANKVSGSENVGLLARVGTDVKDIVITSLRLQNPANIETGPQSNGGFILGYRDGGNGGSANLNNISIVSDKSVTVTAEQNAGGLVGSSTGGPLTVEDCDVTAVPVSQDKKVLAGSIHIKGGENAGGLVGYAEGTVTIDASQVTANADGKIVESADNTGLIEVTGGNAGGVIGQFAGRRLTVGPSTTDETESPALTEKSVRVNADQIKILGNGAAIGGAVGYVPNSVSGAVSIQNTFVEATVLRVELGSAGSGRVSGVTDAVNRYAGGLIGCVMNTGNSLIRNCYVSADSVLHVRAGVSAGGLIGDNRRGSAGTGSGTTDVINCGVIGGSKEKITVDTQEIPNVVEAGNTDGRTSNAGGLIGYLPGGAGAVKVDRCFASTYVKLDSSDDLIDDPSGAGGLIGRIWNQSSSYVIQNSYVGGRTSDGKYRMSESGLGHWNVMHIGGENGTAYPTAGGFIGLITSSASAAEVSNCYTTASVYTNGTKTGISGVGSFVGTTVAGNGNASVNIHDCYSTGIVSAPDGRPSGFIGSVGTYTVTGYGNYYLKGVQGIAQKNGKDTTVTQRRLHDAGAQDDNNEKTPTIDLQVPEDENFFLEGISVDETQKPISDAGTGTPFGKNNSGSEQESDVANPAEYGTAAAVYDKSLTGDENATAIGYSRTVYGLNDTAGQTVSYETEMYRTSYPFRRADENNSTFIPVDGSNAGESDPVSYYHVGDWPKAVPIMDAKLRIVNGSKLTALLAVPADLDTYFANGEEYQPVSFAVRGMTSSNVNGSGDKVAFMELQVSPDGKVSAVSLDNTQLNQNITTSYAWVTGKTNDRFDGSAADRNSRNAGVRYLYGSNDSVSPNSGSSWGGAYEGHTGVTADLKSLADLKQEFSAEELSGLALAGDLVGDDGKSIQPGTGAADSPSALIAGDNAASKYQYIEIDLDDITTQGGNFASIYSGFIPGEDLQIYAEGDEVEWRDLAADALSEQAKVKSQEASAGMSGASGNSTGSAVTFAQINGTSDGAALVREAYTKLYDITARTNSLFADGSNKGSGVAGMTAATAYNPYEYNLLAVARATTNRSYYGSTASNVVLAAASTFDVQTLTNAYGTSVTDYPTQYDGSALVMNGRHLQNLSTEISGVDRDNDVSVVKNKTGRNYLFTKASVRNDILWRNKTSEDGNPVGSEMVDSSIVPFINGTTRQQVFAANVGSGTAAKDAGCFYSIVNKQLTQLRGMDGSSADEAGAGKARHVIANLELQGAKIDNLAKDTLSTGGLGAGLLAEITDGHGTGGFNLNTLNLADPEIEEKQSLSAAGFFIGQTYQNSTDWLYMSNCSVIGSSGTTISAGSLREGDNASTVKYAGGLIGICSGHDILKNVSVDADDIHIESNVMRGGAGGLIGSYYAEQVSIDHGTVGKDGVSNIVIRADQFGDVGNDKSGYAGGLIGGATAVSVATTEAAITNSGVHGKNLTVEAVHSGTTNTKSGGFAGGLVGHLQIKKNDSAAVISNSVVDIKAKSGEETSTGNIVIRADREAGGFIGRAVGISGNGVSGNNISINGSYVQAGNKLSVIAGAAGEDKDNGYSGGVIGRFQGASNSSNAISIIGSSGHPTVSAGSGIDLEGKQDAGGLVGASIAEYNNGSGSQSLLRIENCSVETSGSDGSSEGIYIVGGGQIAYNGSASGVAVRSSTEGYAGGLVGEVKGGLTITGSKVQSPKLVAVHARANINSSASGQDKRNMAGGLVGGTTRVDDGGKSNAGRITVNASSVQSAVVDVFAGIENDIPLQGRAGDGGVTTYNHCALAGGAFGYLRPGTGTVSISGVDVTASNKLQVRSDQMAGGLIAEYYGGGGITLDRCHVLGGGDDDLVEGGNYVGGLAAYLSVNNAKLAVSDSMASVYVRKDGNLTPGAADDGGNSQMEYGLSAVGGLIGDIRSAGSGSSIINSYVGGRTSNGVYGTDTGITAKGRYNVQWVNPQNHTVANNNNIQNGGAGGFIGILENGSGSTFSLGISNCYTTASVYTDATGEKADAAKVTGSFIGHVYGNRGNSNVSVNNCYSTGLVSTAVDPLQEDETNTAGFIGTNEGKLDGSNNYYLLGVNGRELVPVGTGDGYPFEEKQVEVTVPSGNNGNSGNGQNGNSGESGNETAGGNDSGNGNNGTQENNKVETKTITVRTSTFVVGGSKGQDGSPFTVSHSGTSASSVAAPYDPTIPASYPFRTVTDYNSVVSRVGADGAITNSTSAIGHIGDWPDKVKEPPEDKPVLPNDPEDEVFYAGENDWVEAKYKNQGSTRFYYTTDGSDPSDPNSTRKETWNGFNVTEDILNQIKDSDEDVFTVRIIAWDDTAKMWSKELVRKFYLVRPIYYVSVTYKDANNANNDGTVKVGSSISDISFSLGSGADGCDLDKVTIYKVVNGNKTAVSPSDFIEAGVEYSAHVELKAKRHYGFRAPINGQNGGVSFQNTTVTQDNVLIYGEHQTQLSFDADLKASGIPVNEIRVESWNQRVAVGDTIQLAYTILPENASDKTVTCTSADTGIAAVGANGEVTGVSAGTTTVTIRANGGDNKQATITLIVYDNSGADTGDFGDGSVTSRKVDADWGNSGQFSYDITMKNDPAINVETTFRITFNGNPSSVWGVGSSSISGNTATITAYSLPKSFTIIAQGPMGLRITGISLIGGPSTGNTGSSEGTTENPGDGKTEGQGTGSTEKSEESGTGSSTETPGGDASTTGDSGGSTETPSTGGSGSTTDKPTEGSSTGTSSESGTGSSTESGGTGTSSGTGETTPTPPATPSTGNTGSTGTTDPAGTAGAAGSTGSTTTGSEQPSTTESSSEGKNSSGAKKAIGWEQIPEERKEEGTG